eukprot:CAMPEP_0178424176 /NCGR_PEP_ID=MMETSP0689_2-20121128/28075_1 /TAXON_ID=160604 /ORGANISM="Amphidinium massartii, Strain CS-259" /LENGTH=80 /DNA_ID=CAMNT_0020045805 /DNA_START=179 /DNA_END=421 /DNA_ORIENTATION=-
MPLVATSWRKSSELMKLSPSASTPDASKRKDIVCTESSASTGKATTILSGCTRGSACARTSKPLTPRKACTSWAALKARY